MGNGKVMGRRSRRDRVTQLGQTAREAELTGLIQELNGRLQTLDAANQRIVSVHTEAMLKIGAQAAGMRETLERVRASLDGRRWWKPGFDAGALLEDIDKALGLEAGTEILRKMADMVEAIRAKGCAPEAPAEPGEAASGTIS